MLGFMTRASTNSALLPGRRPPGRPRDDSLRARRREDILKKATAVFAKHGYPNADVQFVADPLGISKGTVYRYFESKEALFLAAVERGVLGLERHIDQTVAAVADPIDRIAASIRAYLEFFDQNPALIELFVQERAEFRDRRTPVYFEHGCENCERWREELQGLIRAGRLRDVPVERIQTVIGDAVYGTMMSNHFSGRGRSVEEQAAAVADVVLAGILSDAERSRRGRASELNPKRRNGATGRGTR
jgi:AcrR family transcriptional regulator